MMKCFLRQASTGFFLFCSVHAFCQSADSTSNFTISGYIDAYYAHYSDSVGIDEYQQFPSINSRSDAFGLNTAMVTAQYDAEKVRGVISLHYGDIARSAWSPIFNNIMEAHASIKLINKLWLAAGLFRTHFGTEGLLPKENITSSVSINTFYEPYLESGLRLKYEASEKFFVNLYVLNGYNIFNENNKNKSFGLLTIYTFNENCNIGYSNYIGDDSNDSDRVSRLRIHQNLFFNYQYRKIKLQAGGDFCIQKNSKLSISNKSASMYSGVLTIKFQENNYAAIYTRAETFIDSDGFMSALIINNKGLNISGITAGLEYKPSQNSYVRLEGRELIAHKEQNIFRYNGTSRNYRSEILFNLGVSF